MINLTVRYNPQGKKGIKGFIRSVAHSLLTGPLHKIADYRPYYDAFEKSFLTWENENTKMLGLLCLRFEKRNLRYREDFQKAIEMPFEFLTIPVPENYDHALRHIYGEYMKFDRNNGNVHGGVIFDTDIPYTEYLEKYGQKIRSK